MKSKRPTIVVDLFPQERRELLTVLSSLATDAWHAATVCDGWTVKDLTAHILADDLNILLEIGDAVSWAGPEPAPRWLHIAREYTERWMHQQQIRDAAGLPGLYERRLFFPVLDTFVHALPHTYRHVVAPDDVHVRLAITGEAGGVWSLVRLDGRWQLAEDVATAPASTVTLDQDTAWRLFTRGIDRDATVARTTVVGDERLGAVLLDAVAIIA